MAGGKIAKKLAEAGSEALTKFGSKFDRAELIMQMRSEIKDLAKAGQSKEEITRAVQANGKYADIAAQAETAIDEAVRPKNILGNAPKQVPAPKGVEEVASKAKQLGDNLPSAKGKAPKAKAPAPKQTAPEVVPEQPAPLFAAKPVEAPKAEAPAAEAPAVPEVPTIADEMTTPEQDAQALFGPKSDTTIAEAPPADVPSTTTFTQTETPPVEVPPSRAPLFGTNPAPREQVDTTIPADPFPKAPDLDNPPKYDAVAQPESPKPGLLGKGAKVGAGLGLTAAALNSSDMGGAPKEMIPPPPPASAAPAAPAAPVAGEPVNKPAGAAAPKRETMEGDPIEIMTNSVDVATQAEADLRKKSPAAADELKGVVSDSVAELKALATSIKEQQAQAQSDYDKRLWDARMGEALTLFAQSLVKYAAASEGVRTKTAVADYYKDTPVSFAQQYDAIKLQFKEGMDTLREQTKGVQENIKQLQDQAFKAQENKDERAFKSGESAADRASREGIAKAGLEADAALQKERLAAQKALAELRGEYYVRGQAAGNPGGADTTLLLKSMAALGPLNALETKRQEEYRQSMQHKMDSVDKAKTPVMREQAIKALAAQHGVPVVQTPGVFGSNDDLETTYANTVKVMERGMPKSEAQAMAAEMAKQVYDRATQNKQAADKPASPAQSQPVDAILNKVASSEAYKNATIGTVLRDKASAKMIVKTANGPAYKN